ncbi:hypothetical protein V3C41_00145 [Paenarthrobacter nicotinovorans]|uniref:Pentapeptide repeat protein n=1 Tax=Paenarthrobacter nicotinovorans TaxID=29320 RepID=A0ABV0GLZ9_PAENI
MARLIHHLSDDIDAAPNGRHAPRMPKFLPMLLASFVVASGAFWLVFVGLARLSGFDVAPWNPDLGAIAPERLFDITRAGATAAGVLAGVFAIVYAYRKQKVQEASGRREDSQLLSTRYQDAAEQLGHEKQAVVLAGVYAMSRLADDWTDQRQQCVDVLCAYLRLSQSWDDETDHMNARQEDVVRRAIIAEILKHTEVDGDQTKSWSHLRIDLSGARLDGLRTWANRFETLILSEARFFGDNNIDAQIGSLLDLTDAQIHGSLRLNLDGSDARVSAWGAHIHSGGSLYAGSETRTGTSFTFGSTTVDAGGRLAATLPAGSRKKTLDFYNVNVTGELAVYGKGEGCEKAAVYIRDASTVGQGRIGFQQQIAQAENDIVFPRPSSLKDVKLSIFTVGEWEVVED